MIKNLKELIKGLVQQIRREVAGCSSKIKKHASAVLVMSISKTQNSLSLSLYIYLELDSARETLAKCPIGWNNIWENSCFSISGCDSEW